VSGGSPIPDVQGEDGVFELDLEAGAERAPCVEFVMPDGGGGNCFVAVGERGGWALEAVSVTSDHDVVFFGAAIGQARRVRIGKVATIRKLHWLKRFRLRFFAQRVPRRKLRVRPNRIVALDRRGRLLGRQHWRDENGNYGRCDGIWDRRHCPH
jgi:hypothetical protein